jgi:hypothetical protein
VRRGVWDRDRNPSYPPTGVGDSCGLCDVAWLAELGGMGGGARADSCADEGGGGGFDD